MPYSAKIVERIMSADPTMLGVSLGRTCLERQIPVSRVCRDLDVSKATVYRWFTGMREVNKHLRLKVQAYQRATNTPA